MLDYLGVIPHEVPAGRIVVHNSVRPTRWLGSRGFRAWLAEPADEYVACDCAWAPELGIHYRVHRGGGVVIRLRPYSRDTPVR
jgi:hypothetical protein